jgi:hypothetical protein
MPQCLNCGRSYEGSCCPVCDSSAVLSSKPDDKTSKIYPWVWAGAFVACVVARFAYDLVDDTTIFWVSLAPLLLPLAGLFFASSVVSRGLELCSILGPLALALLLIGNGALDKSRPVQISAKVFDRTFSTRARYSTHGHHLMVAPSWRPNRSHESLGVSSYVYDKTHVDDIVTFDLHPGFFTCLGMTT